LARDKLVKAKPFVTLANLSNVGVEDLEMEQLERTDELMRSKQGLKLQVSSKECEPVTNAAHLAPLSRGPDGRPKGQGP